MTWLSIAHDRFYKLTVHGHDEIQCRPDAGHWPVHERAKPDDVHPFPVGGRCVDRFKRYGFDFPSIIFRNRNFSEPLFSKLQSSPRRYRRKLVRFGIPKPHRCVLLFRNDERVLVAVKIRKVGMGWRTVRSMCNSKTMNQNSSCKRIFHVSPMQHVAQLIVAIPGQDRRLRTLPRCLPATGECRRWPCLPKPSVPTPRRSPGTFAMSSWRTLRESGAIRASLPISPRMPSRHPRDRSEENR